MTEQNLPAVNVANLEEFAQNIPMQIEQAAVLLPTLGDNHARFQRCIDAGNQLLADINAAGGVMTEELDERANNYLVRTKETITLIQGNRKPITQGFDRLISMFTSLENLLDKDKTGTVANSIQVKRNLFAQDKKNKAAEEKRKQELQVNKTKEKAALNVSAETQIEQAFRTSANNAILRLRKTFTNITLENHEQAKKDIQNGFPVYMYEEYKAIPVSLRAQYLDQPEVLAVIETARTGKFENYQARYKEALDAERRILIEKIPGKLAQLKAIQEASTAEVAEALKAEDQQLGDEMIDQAQQAAVQDQHEVQQEAITRTLTETTTAVFNSVSARPMGTVWVGDRPAKKSGRSKTKWEITVSNPAGYGLLFAFWLAREGAEMDDAAIRRKNIDSIVTYCEKWANNNGDKIESDYILYSEKTVAINRS